MALSKKKFKIIFEKIIFSYFVVFPLGQLVRVLIPYKGLSIRVNLADLVVLLGAFLYVFSKKKNPVVLKNITDFILVAAFSLVFSISFIPVSKVTYGLLYLVRFISYTLFFAGTYSYISGKKEKKDLLIKSLLLVTLVTAFFGWIQYIFLPDTRFLKFFNWDDHLYRLSGSFLDPGYTGIVLVFGALLSIYLYLKNKRKLYILSFAFLLFSVAYTYSRASYLALIAGLVPIVIKRKLIKKAIMTVFLFITVILMLPRPGGDGVKLERLHSIYARIRNYSETAQIIESYPIFGVGFNNICEVKLKTIKGAMADSHACSGSDSSLLLVFATTGIIGLIVFIYMSGQILLSVKGGGFEGVFYSVSAALFIHSLFMNSLFYSWVMGWMGILLAISQAKSRTVT
jgi:hypothetical protein